MKKGRKVTINRKIIMAEAVALALVNLENRKENMYSCEPKPDGIGMIPASMYPIAVMADI